MRRTTNALCTALVAGALGACTDPPLTVGEGPIPDAPGLHLECVTAVVIDGAAQVIGLDGAALGGAAVSLTDASGGALASATADVNGRFHAPLAAQVGDTIGLSNGGEIYPLRVRDAQSALAVAHPPYEGGAGSTPNDLLVMADGRAVLVRSGDDALVVFDVGEGPAAGRGIRLPEGAVPANPWFVAAVDAGRVAVTAQGRSLVYLVDLDSGLVTDTVRAPAPLPLDAPFALPRPLDVDGDGTPETSITAAPARAPQGLAVSGDRLVVAYSGFLAGPSGGRPAVFGPGLIASWSLADPSAPPVVVRTPALNPQEVHARPDGTVLVTQSGAIDFAADGRVLTSSGAVSQLDATTLATVRSWTLGDFGPSSAVLTDDALWVTSLKQGQVRAISLDGGPPTTLVLNAEAIESVFRWVELPCGLLGAPSFDTDRLHVIDPRTRALDPPPFTAPLVLGPGRPLIDGLNVVARRPGRAGLDFVGPDLFALANVASRVTPVELRRILGP